MERMHEGGCVVVDDTADTVRESVFDQASPDLSNVLCIPDFPRVDYPRSPSRNHRVRRLRWPRH